MMLQFTIVTVAVKRAVIHCRLAGSQLLMKTFKKNT
jgi:hypothetical protein